MKRLSDSAIMGINALVLLVACLSIGFSLNIFTTISQGAIGLIATLGGIIIMLIADIILYKIGLIKF